MRKSSNVDFQISSNQNQISSGDLRMITYIKLYQLLGILLIIILDLIFMTSFLSDHEEDSAVSPHFQLNSAKNVTKLQPISPQPYMNEEYNSVQYLGQRPTYAEIGHLSDIAEKRPKYFSVRKIEQKPPKKTTKNPCGNQKCRVCRKVKPVPDRKYLEFLTRKKIKAPLPALPLIKPVKQNYQQVHLLFDNKIKNQGRKVKSVINPSIDDYQYSQDQQMKSSIVRAPVSRKYYTESEEPIRKYVKINGKMYEIIDPDTEYTQQHHIPTQSHASHGSHRQISSVKALINSINEGGEDRQSWRIRKEEQENQRQELNKLVQKNIRLQTMFFHLKNDGLGSQPISQRRNKQPQKMTIYRLKDDQLVENKDLFQSIHERQASKNIENEVEQQEQTQVYNIKFPTVSEIQSSISNYQSLTGQFNIETLKKSKNYFREYSDKEGNQFLYFGGFDSQKKQRKGFGVLVSKKSILQGVWMKNFIVKGAELKANSLYKGEFSNNKKHGEGTCKWLNGEQYMGEWSNGLRNGQGYWSSKNNKETYSGEWKNGKVFGYGQYYKKDISFYKGTFQNFVKNGLGVQQFDNGDKFEGKYLNGVPEGYGTYSWSCGLKYEGEFKKGQRQGKGRLGMIGYFELEGMFQKQRPHGICQLKLRNKDIFNGKYVYGEKYGYGKLQNSRAGISREGFWNHGMLQQKINLMKKQMRGWDERNQKTYQP